MAEDETDNPLGTKNGVVHFGYDATSNEGKPMKATIIAAGMFLVVGAQASYAQTARDTTSEGQATINEEQKLGPNAGTSQVGNERDYHRCSRCCQPSSGRCATSREEGSCASRAAGEFDDCDWQTGRALATALTLTCPAPASIALAIGAVALSMGFSVESQTRRNHNRSRNHSLPFSQALRSIRALRGYVS